MIIRNAAIACLALVAMLATACGGSSPRLPPFGVTVAPVATGSVPAGAARAGGSSQAAQIGGKPALRAPESGTSVPDDGGNASNDANATADHADSSTVAVSATTPTPATPIASDGSRAPDSGRWIDVNVSTLVVRLIDGASTLREIEPVAVGTQVDTGEYASTQTGLFHVYNKIPDLVYDPPYDTYISHWVGFDPDKANGFHSFLKDKSGKVVDPATGRVSNGCIRTGAAEILYLFAEVGMPVWVHR